MAPLTINVTGDAAISRTAERAIIDFNVSLTGKTQEETSKQVTDKAQEIQVMLKPLGPTNDSEEARASSPITRWTMAALSTSSHDADENVGTGVPNIVFEASVKFNLRVRDFERVGMLVGRLSQMPLVSLQRTAWDLTENTKESFISKLRKMAAADALARARDYSETLGLDKISPLELHESKPPSVDYNDGRYGRQAARNRPKTSTMGQRRVYDGQDGQGTDFENLFFEPDEICMSAIVTCKFTAETSSEADKNKKRKLTVISKGVEDAEMQ